MNKLSRRQRYEAKEAARKASAALPAPIVEQAIERAREAGESMQPRFQADAGTFFSSTINWLKRAETSEPAYSSNSRGRDDWLQQFILYEPHLAGIMSSVASIDSNRGWTLTGGRNQVRRFANALHNFAVAGDINGWRPGTRAMSMQFHGVDMGAVAEIGRDGDLGPFAGFYSVDPSHTLLTGLMETPLQYFPSRGDGQKWRPEDYLRVTDMGFNAERFNGLGYCAVSRCLELAKTMVGVLFHDQEQLAARMPKGLLLLRGISQDNWDNAMAAREANLTAKERQYYGGIEVLANQVEEISATLVALSTLPADFNLETFTNLTMYGYSLCFGYDAREFWPVSGGALGTATETEVQHRKATQKGAGDFSLNHQEQIQREDILPNTIEFGYDERDVGGELQEIEVNTAVASLVNSLFASNAGGLPLLDPDPEIARQRAMQMLAEAGVVHQEWTEYEEDVTATDEEDVQLRVGSRREMARRDSLLAHENIYRACETFPDEPIVRYRWRAGFSDRVVIAPSGKSVVERRSHPARNSNPRIRAAEQALERASKLAEALIAPPPDGVVYYPRERLVESEVADMPQLSLVIRDNLSPHELEVDIEEQIKTIRARAKAEIELRIARDGEVKQAQAEREKRERQLEDTLALMKQVVEGQIVERERLLNPTINITMPPAPPAIIQVALPPRAKQRISFIKKDGKTVGAELE